MISLGKYSKTILALIGAGVVILTRAFGADSPVVSDIVVVLAALGVYTVSNTP